MVGGDIEVRWAELATIERVLDHTPASPTRVVVIDGEPGIGKTHLLAHAIRMATERNLLVIDGGLTEVEQDLPWAGLGSLLRHLDEWLPAGFPSAHQDHLDRALRRIPTGNVAPSEVAFAFGALISTVVVERPLVIVVDDLQWLDRPSAAALATALRATTNGRLTLVVAIRSGHESLLDVARIAEVTVERIHLTGMSVAGLYQVMLHAGIPPPPRPMLVQIHARSNGNPFRAIDLGRRAPGDTSHLGADDLNPAARRALIEPTAIEVGRLCALMTRPTARLIRELVVHGDIALGELERAGVIRTDVEEIRFTHPLQRDAMLEGAGMVEIRSMHQRIAAVLTDPDLTLLHRAEAADTRDADLAAAMERAGQEAIRLGLPELAARRFMRAVSLTPLDANRDRHHRLQAFVHESIEVGDLDHLELATELFESAYGSDEIRRATVDLSELHRQIGDLSAAVETCQAGLDRLGDPSPARIDVLRRLARLQQFTDVRAGLRTTEQLARDAAATGDPDLIALADGMLASARCLVGLPFELREVSPPDPRNEEFAAQHVAEALVWSTRVAEAERLLGPAVAEVRRRGKPHLLMKFLNQLGDAHLRCGRWDEALAELDEAADISALMGDAGGGRSDLAWLQAVRGDTASARAQIALEAPLVSEGAHLWRIQHLARAGLVEICAGRWADAAHLLEEARSIADTVGLFEAAPIPFGQDLVEALLKVGRVDDAAAEAEHLLAAARRAELPLPLALASRSIALVHSARSEHAAGIASVMASIAIHADIEDPFHAARTELAAGDILRRGGRRADARRHFDIALQMFDELGATCFSKAARAGLDRLATRTAVHELTETERRVAELAAAGRSNTEISGEMFIAVRTVESNLTRVYRKLAVRSRSQLAGALAPRS